MFVIDALGSPYGEEVNLLSVLGDGTDTSNGFLDVIWPKNSRVQLVKAVATGRTRLREQCG